MNSKINKILSEIKKKKEELSKEYQKIMSKYGFSFDKLGKIIFNKEQRLENKKYKKKIIDTIFSAQIRELLSMPFIYFMIFPSIIMDLSIFIYQNICFRLYDIPLVKRSDYISYDKKELDYLNLIQKINCLYCSYVNGLFQFAVEVAGRTERYWCPIKHAKKLKGGHDWEEYFADYGSTLEFSEAFKIDNKLIDLKNINKK